MPNEPSASFGPLKMPARSRTPLLDGIRASKKRKQVARTRNASPSKRCTNPQPPRPASRSGSRPSSSTECNSTAYAAALIGAVINWAKRQDPTVDLPATAHADSLRVYLKGYKMEYRPS